MLLLKLVNFDAEMMQKVIQEASTVEIISMLQKIDVFVSTHFEQGIPEYEPSAPGVLIDLPLSEELSVAANEFIILLAQELKDRQAKQPLEVDVMEVAAALAPLAGKFSVTALVDKCGEYSKDGKNWCIFKHDSKDHKKKAKTQPKGWPKHYSTKEEADKGLKMMHVFSSASEILKYFAPEDQKPAMDSEIAKLLKTNKGAQQAKVTVEGEPWVVVYVGEKPSSESLYSFLEGEGFEF